MTVKNSKLRGQFKYVLAKSQHNSTCRRWNVSQARSQVLKFEGGKIHF